MTDEAKPKGKRGGARPGAGRKPSTLKGVLKTLPKDQAQAILAECRSDEKWRKLLNSPKESIRLETLKYLTDRAYGKARQDGQVAVGVMNFTPPEQAQPLLTGEQKSNIEERIAALQRELGMCTEAEREKAVAEEKHRLQEEFRERERALQLPPAPITPSAQCGKHGPYDGKDGQQCPECLYEWKQANEQESARWRGLMPGEPAWSGRRM